MRLEVSLSSTTTCSEANNGSRRRYWPPDPDRTGAMQDAASRLRRRPLPRARVNRGARSRRPWCALAGIVLVVAAIDGCGYFGSLTLWARVALSNFGSDFVILSQTRFMVQRQARALRQMGCSKAGTRGSRPPSVSPTRPARSTCKWRKKRRGRDSNPRDGLTPPTRFPVALLRPTRTPLQGDGPECTKSSVGHRS